MAFMVPEAVAGIGEAAAAVGAVGTAVGGAILPWIAVGTLAERGLDSVASSQHKIQTIAKDVMNGARLAQLHEANTFLDKTVGVSEITNKMRFGVPVDRNFVELLDHHRTIQRMDGKIVDEDKAYSKDLAYPPARLLQEIADQKTFTVNNALTDFFTAPTWYQELTAMSRGNSHTNRSGDCIRSKRVKVHTNFTNNGFPKPIRVEFFIGYSKGRGAPSLNYFYNTNPDGTLGFRNQEYMEESYVLFRRSQIIGAHKTETANIDEELCIEFPPDCITKFNTTTANGVFGGGSVEWKFGGITAFWHAAGVTTGGLVHAHTAFELEFEDY